VAIDLIINDNLTISEAAFRTGFSNISVFSKTFKKYYGTSPSKYFKEFRRIE